MPAILGSILTKLALAAIEAVVTRALTRLWTDYAHSRRAAAPAYA
ncbi:hypothetical protein GCM10009654_51530 [Streptomyces hebeiensis]|uniref:Uncharacterized protein n=1 Tax=Streptomyces hebeiensis TaxID=229486 RepID=A0ABN1V0Q9_9ACTN